MADMANGRTRLKAWRVAHDLSTRKLGKLVNDRNGHSIVKYETGFRHLPIPLAVAVATETGLPPRAGVNEVLAQDGRCTQRAVAWPKKVTKRADRQWAHLWRNRQEIRLLDPRGRRADVSWKLPRDSPGPDGPSPACQR